VEQLRNLTLPSLYSTWQEWAAALVGQLEEAQQILPIQLPTYTTTTLPQANEDGLLVYNITESALQITVNNEWETLMWKDYYSEVAAGNVSGSSIMRALGERESMGTTAAGEDLWRGNELSAVPSAPASHTTIPTPDSAGEQMTLICEDANDTSAGTGIQEVTIEYLDATGAEQTTTVTTNGTTGVDLTPATVRFINDMYASAVGSTGVAAGHIRVYKKTDDTLVYNMIAAGGNKSLVPHRMVPLGKYLILKGWHADEAQKKRVNVRIRSTDMEGVLLPGVFCFKDAGYYNQTTSGYLPLNTKIPALSIVKISAWPDAVGAEAGCSWWGELRTV